jgi:hypothetical protein
VRTGFTKAQIRVPHCSGFSAVFNPTRQSGKRNGNPGARVPKRGVKAAKDNGFARRKLASEPVMISEPGVYARQTPGVSIELGLRLRSRLFRGRSRSGLHRGVRRSRSIRTRGAARGSHRSRAGRRHRGTAGRGRGTTARRRSSTSRGRGTRRATTTATAAAPATAAITTATAVVMVVVVLMVAAAAATTTAAAAAISTATTTTAALVREQAGGRWARSGDQERRSGHHGRKQSLAKHQRSPHLLKF